MHSESPKKKVCCISLRYHCNTIKLRPSPRVLRLRHGGLQNQSSVCDVQLQQQTVIHLEKENEEMRLGQ